MANDAALPVLVVEDEESIRRGLCDVLAFHGYRPEGAERGDDGLQRGLANQHALVILDVMLPGLSGIDVCRRLREDLPRLPILMLTARGAEQDVLEGFRAGADDYVTKPFSVAELVARVEALLRRAGTPARRRPGAGLRLRSLGDRSRRAPRAPGRRVRRADAARGHAAGALRRGARSHRQPPQAPPGRLGLPGSGPRGDAHRGHAHRQAASQARRRRQLVDRDRARRGLSIPGMRRIRLALLAVAVALGVPVALLAWRALDGLEVERAVRQQAVAERAFDEMERGALALPRGRGGAATRALSLLPARRRALAALAAHRAGLRGGRLPGGRGRKRAHAAAPPGTRARLARAATGRPRPRCSAPSSA